MTGYIKKFMEDIIKCLRVKDEQLLKNYNKKWKKNWKVHDYRFLKRTLLW